MIICMCCYSHSVKNKFNLVTLDLHIILLFENMYRAMNTGPSIGFFYTKLKYRTEGQRKIRALPKNQKQSEFFQIVF